MKLVDVKKLFGDIQGVRVVPSPPFKELTTIGTGGRARALLVPETQQSLCEILSRLENEGIAHFVFGGGSNILISEGWVDKAAISLGRNISEVELNGAGIIADGGATLARVAVIGALAGLSGMEELSGIPGTLGGGVRMNAGAFGREFSDLVKWVEVAGIRGDTVKYGAKDLIFEYRKCLVPARGIITRVYLDLSRGDRDAIFSRMRDFNRKRRKQQPWGEKTFGSVFKNPEGGYAAKLIEGAGLKGMRVGKAKVSEKHANFIVNEGRATTSHILDLMERVEKAVYQKYGTKLEPEVQYIE